MDRERLESSTTGNRALWLPIVLLTGFVLLCAPSREAAASGKVATTAAKKCKKKKAKGATTAKRKKCKKGGSGGGFNGPDSDYGYPLDFTNHATPTVRATATWTDSGSPNVDVDLHVHDAQGRHDGFKIGSGAAEVAIPGTAFLEADGNPAKTEQLTDNLFHYSGIDNREFGYYLCAYGGTATVTVTILDSKGFSYLYPPRSVSSAGGAVELTPPPGGLPAHSPATC